MTAQERLDTAYDYISEFEILASELSVTRDLIELVFQEADTDQPRQRILLSLSDACLDRIHNENEKIQDIFKKLFDTLYKK